jgi:hypothetical protein
MLHFVSACRSREPAIRLIHQHADVLVSPTEPGLQRNLVPKPAENRVRMNPS